MKNILLIGYRCTGKSSVGRRLAGRMGVPFVDTDEMIVAREGASIREIVEREGWRFFREREKEVVLELSSVEGSVIATGGGILEDGGNRMFLGQGGIMVWLTADADTICRRMMGDHRNEDTRPVLVHGDISSDIAATLGRREPLYRRMADVTVDTSGKTIETVVDEIYAQVKGTE